MMGKAHALSGAAVFFAGSAILSATVLDEPLHAATLLMGAAVFTGAALLPDLDSYSATVTKSFGIFGRILYYIFNAISVLLYNATKTRREEVKTNGHRTFTHTLVFCVLTTAAVWGLTSIPGDVDIFGKTFPVAGVIGLLIMAFFLHLAIAAVFSNQIKKFKKAGSLFYPVIPYVIMVISLGITAMIAVFIPAQQMNYHYLAVLVGLGAFVHIMGDFITKMGVPLFWPIPIRGKRWYDVALPSFLRIEAGGAFELKVLTPLFYVVILLGIIANALFMFNVI